MEKILAIDDNSDNLIVLRALLIESFPDMQFISCQSGRKGISLALEQQPDVILLDLIMPEIDGYEVCRILKENERTRIIPVIILTAARTDKENRIKALEVGADAFLTKPLDESELIVQIRAMLRIKASEDYKQNEKENLTRLVAERTRELEESQVAMLNLLEDLKEENESRKKIEMALRESETHYRTLANSGQALVWTSGIDKKCDYFNQPWLDFTGRALEQEIGDGWVAGVHPDDLPYCLDVYINAFDNHEKFSMEYRLLHVSGDYRWIQDNGSPRYNSNGEFIGYIGHCLDITEHKLNEQKIVENEKLLTNIIENIPTSLILKDANTLRYQMMNKAGEQLLGLKRELAIGKNVYEIFHLADAEYLNAKDQTALMTGAVLDDSEANLFIQGRGNLIIHTIRVPIKNDQGTIDSLVVLTEDITEKKQIEKALIESEQMYRTLLNASPEGIVILDMQHKIVEMSDIVLEIFGIPNKNDFVGENVFSFIPDKEVDKLTSVLQRTLEEGRIHQVEFMMSRFDKSLFHCELSTTLIHDANGNPKSYMAILRDITERKEIERQLLRTERMVSLGEMASAMAHEINQPLLSISLSIDNLLMKMKQANVVDEAYFTNKSTKIFEDVSRISRLIDHVRTFSRDHDREKPLPFDINESIRNAVAMISEQFLNHGVRVTLELDQDIPLVRGNVYQLEQVVLNLLTNAKDAVEEKENTQHDFEMHIEVRTYHDERFNYLEIKDNGVGIHSNDIDQIMLPFYTTKDVGKGTGLGLSISYGIVKEMGGTIQIESEWMIGSLFRVCLPFMPIQQEMAWV
ncbi:PAS domain S-box protein [Microbacter margulisiae]|uniref:histidine kinase n=1 Tax=Microbacter margulisiae TaxID=1350067 RepID=A0A7W5H3B2_9PORP|nr:PAS domain S-box protein [Microbacter margulisiae]MBB3188222.1 PAS domain S-box-containing protein [Microbacter margulisiae]